MDGVLIVLIHALSPVTIKYGVTRFHINLSFEIFTVFFTSLGISEVAGAAARSHNLNTNLKCHRQMNMVYFFYP